MTPRERLLITLTGGKADRLPGTVHQFQDYWLKNFAEG